MRCNDYFVIIINFSSKFFMETPDENLRAALLQLKVLIMDVDLLRNDSVDHYNELDKIKENLDNAFLLIAKVLNWDLKK